MDTVVGEITRKRVARSSKSEHDAIVVECEAKDGDQDTRAYILRRPEENPFDDPVLSALVGRRVRLRGHIRGKRMFVLAWEDVK